MIYRKIREQKKKNCLWYVGNIDIYYRTRSLQSLLFLGPLNNLESYFDWYIDTMASKLGILRYDMASFVFTYWINYWARQWVSWFAPFIKTSHNNVSHLSFLVNNLWKQILSNVYSSILAFLIRKLKLKVPSSK